MKVPEQLFAIINPVVRFLLRSPLHVLFSSSLMLVTFTGRKSGKSFTTPVRYVRDGETIRCFSSAENRWWRNLRGGATIVLRVRGQEARYAARLIEDDAAEIEKWLRYYLALFPADAVYHDIRLNRDKTLVEEDIPAAVAHAVVVEATPQ